MFHALLVLLTRHHLPEKVSYIGYTRAATSYCRTRAPYTSWRDTHLMPVSLMSLCSKTAEYAVECYNADDFGPSRILLSLACCLHQEKGICDNVNAHVCQMPCKDCWCIGVQRLTMPNMPMLQPFWDSCHILACIICRAAVIAMRHTALVPCGFGTCQICIGIAALCAK